MVSSDRGLEIRILLSEMWKGGGGGGLLCWDDNSLDGQPIHEILLGVNLLRIIFLNHHVLRLCEI